MYHFVFALQLVRNFFPHFIHGIFKILAMLCNYEFTLYPLVAECIAIENHEVPFFSIKCLENLIFQIEYFQWAICWAFHILCDWSEFLILNWEFLLLSHNYTCVVKNQLTWGRRTFEYNIIQFGMLGCHIREYVCSYFNFRRNFLKRKTKRNETRTTTTKNKYTETNKTIVMFYESWACFPLLYIYIVTQHSSIVIKRWGLERHATNRLLFSSKQVSTIYINHFICTFIHSFFFLLGDERVLHKKISVENEHSLNFIYQISWMKYSLTARGGRGSGC